MKLWIATLASCTCLAFSANMLMAQPTDDTDSGDKARKARRRPPRDGEQGERAPGRRQGPAGKQRDGEQAGRGQMRPPIGPVFRALDTDKDGILSAGEIASASASLKKLDKNGDGKIDRAELRPRHARPGQDGDAKGPRDGKGPRGDRQAKDGDGRGPKADDADGPRRGPRRGDRRPPRPPVDED